MMVFTFVIAFWAVFGQEETKLAERNTKLKRTNQVLLKALQELSVGSTGINEEAAVADGTPYDDKGLRNFMEQLWNIDNNRLTPDVDYELDLQGRTRYSFDGPDMARDPLFSRVNSEVFERPTYKAFIKLLDNYVSKTGVKETVTTEESKENWSFINLVFESECMNLAYKFLKHKGKVTDEQQFKQDFYDMWFKLYKRSSRVRSPDSSKFENVFVGETKEDMLVIGFHNWIQFYLQEKAGTIDYKGFMSSDKNPHLLTIQFSWNGLVKPKGSFFFGTSPEFEITMYTVLYLLGHDAYKIALGGEEVIIQCPRDSGKFSACYPQMPRMPREN